MLSGESYCNLFSFKNNSYIDGSQQKNYLANTVLVGCICLQESRENQYQNNKWLKVMLNFSLGQTNYGISKFLTY